MPSDFKPLNVHSADVDAIDFNQAYKAVELAYSQGHFPQALDLADELLRNQSADSSDPQAQRLKLLIGHIHFYGLQQPAEAAQLYRDVLETGTDPTYRDLADQGLAFCRNALAKTPPAGPKANLDEDLEVDVLEALEIPEAPATPWLSGTDQPSATDQLSGTGQRQPTAGSAAGEASAENSTALEISPPAASPVEQVRVEVLDEVVVSETPRREAPTSFSSSEEDELAKGLLRVVLR